MIHRGDFFISLSKDRRYAAETEFLIMKKIMLTDITLSEAGNKLSFKEKVEIAKVLDKLGINAIRLFPIQNRKPDTMAIRTIAAVVESAVLSIPAGFTTESVDEAWDAVSTARHAELYIAIPTSAVRMEYICGKKPEAVLDQIRELVSHAAKKTKNVHFAADDAGRSEPEFLIRAIEIAINAGASAITVCDSAGTMLPHEIAAFLHSLVKRIPALSTVRLEIQCSDSLSVAAANAAEAALSGASGICVCALGSDHAPSLPSLVQILRIRGDSLGFSSNIKTTEINRALRALGLVSGMIRPEIPALPSTETDDLAALGAGDDIVAVAAAVKKLGYDLSDDDMNKVYEAFLGVAAKKSVGAVELEALVAAVALQVPDTYTLVNFIITSGHGIASTAYIQMKKNGEMIEGVCAGHGPIDAAFMAVDKIVGRKYELDDFQIQSVTEGKEAMGSALVKLRRDGKLYSGNGISTDIIGSSIRAYVNAINKIAYEETV